MFRYEAVGGARQRSRYSNTLRAKRLGVRTPAGARFSAPVHITSPASCALGTASFPGVRRTVRGAEPPTPFSAHVKERIKLYIHLCLHGML